MPETVRSKVFIIEDDDQMGDDNANYLQVDGELDPVLIIRNFNDFSQAVLDGHQFRIFLVDINLGFGREAEGLEIIKEARLRFPDAFIIAFSAYEFRNVESKIAGADAFFIKKDYRETMRKISALVNERRQQTPRVMPTMLFYANVAHVNLEEEIVKLDCFMDDLNFERYFQLLPIAAAIGGPVEVNTALEVRVHQLGSAIMTRFQKLDSIPGRPSIDWRNEENSIDLTQSSIWTNKLNNGD